MTAQTDANTVLMGAVGPPAASFADPGATYEGKIVAPPQSYQVREFDRDNPGTGALKFFPSGDPIMGVTVDIATTDRDVAYDNDDGIRRAYLEHYLKDAVRNAVKSAGAKGLEVGGFLRITFTHREDPTDKRSRKFWDVSYTPAGNAALMNDGQPLLGGDKPVPASTPARGAADTARQLFLTTTLTDAQIAAAAGLTVGAVAILRAQTQPQYSEPPF